MFAALALICFSFRIIRTVYPLMMSFRGSTPYVFLSERQPSTADFLSVVIRLSKWLNSSFTLRLICFGCLIWKVLAAAQALELDQFDSDWVLKSSKHRRIIATFIATLKFGVPSNNDNSCWFFNSMNWKQGLSLLKTLKRTYRLFIFVVYFNFKFLVNKTWRMRGECTDCWGR